MLTSFYIIAKRLAIYQRKISQDFASVKKPCPLTKNSKKKNHIRGCEREYKKDLRELNFWKKLLDGTMKTKYEVANIDSLHSMLLIH